MNLEPAARSLLEQFPAGVRAELARKEARVEKLGQLAFCGLLCIIVIAVVGLLYAILDRFVFSGDNPFVGILLMMFIVFSLLSLAYVIYRESLKDRPRAAGPEETRPEFAPPPVTARLIEEREFAPVPSVTDDTTNLLPSRSRDRQS